jgi:hypothetical protein
LYSGELPIEVLRGVQTGSGEVAGFPSAASRMAKRGRQVK